MNRIPTCTLLALATAIAMALAMAACSRPEPPDTERPPEPQAVGTQVAAPAASLDDSLHAPIDRAKAVEDTLQDAAQRQRDAIDAAGG